MLLISLFGAYTVVNGEVTDAVFSNLSLLFYDTFLPWASTWR